MLIKVSQLPIYYDTIQYLYIVKENGCVYAVYNGIHSLIATLAADCKRQYSQRTCCQEMSARGLVCRTTMMTMMIVTIECHIELVA